MSPTKSFRGQITLARVFGALVVLYAVFQWGLKESAPAALLSIALFVVGAVLAFRLVRRTIRRSIWRLSNRLYVTYVFIGAVPVLLFLALAAAGTYFVTGQVAVYLVDSELQRRAAALSTPAHILSLARPAERASIAHQMGALLGERMRGLQFAVSGDQTLNYPAGSTLETPPEGWKDFTGYLRKGNATWSAAIVKNGGTTVVAIAPISQEVLRDSLPGLGAVRIGDSGRFAGAVPATAAGWGKLDFTTIFFNPIHVVRWDRPLEESADVLFVTTRPSAVLTTVFGNGVEFGQIVTVAFAIFVVLLILAELISLFIGVQLTRTIFRAVHDIYEGTLQIAKGDFSARIPVNGKDQLAELAQSFNNMTEQIENLVVIAKEKERLQSEVEIAGEVQNQLFPRSAPSMRTIELIGVCQAARMVSGDYYDYLCLPDGNLAIAIGDVAGKGISAALLMASIQSIMRTQLAAGLARSATAGSTHVATHVSTSSMVAQLNRQLYASTAPEKYATFFFGVYEEHSRMLTYTNAGHLQPLLLRGGKTQLLEVTGTVVGAFPVIRYEEKTVEIGPGDLFIAYTDGITEPENAYGEEFGMERMAETALRHQNCEPAEIVAKIMEAVTHWSTAPELPDDMTVVIARGLV